MRFEVRDLAVGFGGRAIQRGVSFALEPGRGISLAGPSGSGKTTLLRSLAWLDAPIEGRVTLGGKAPQTLGVPAWRRRVVFVAQRAVFFGGLVHEELARPFAYRISSRVYDDEAALEALDALGIRKKHGAPVDELSEGERQRVALVRAALLQPDVLLLDEPTSALDAQTKERVESWLRGLPGARVLVSHDRDQWARLADETFELEVHDA